MLSWLRQGILFFLLPIICFTALGQPGTGLSTWALSPVNDSGVVVINWKTTPPEVSNFTSINPSLRANSVTAVNHCGEPVFYVIHSGVLNNPNSLFIYDLEGIPLLDNTTGNGPGLNSKCFSGEIQVVNVPGNNHEWFIIYQEWKTGSGAPLNDGDYVPAKALFSRVSYRCGAITVIDRDIPITASGTAYNYRNGAALGILPGDPGKICFYKVRWPAGNSTFSIDRFLIEADGINFDRNTGNINTDNWNLSVSGSPIEVSSDGRWIAVNNRDQSINGDTFILLDAAPFNNTSGNYRIINLGELMLQPDNNIVLNPGSVDNIANTNPSLRFLQNMESKILDIEFSPNSRFLYYTTGGFAGAGYSCTTYLGQIETGTAVNPEPYPYKLRLQIQIPAGPFDPNSGLGGLESSYPDTYHPVWEITRGYNDQMYFIKRNSPWIFRIPYPDQTMPQNLVPSQIDLSDVTHPNIKVQGKIWILPDQIDGYDYETSLNPAIYLGNDTAICEGLGMSITPGGQFASYCWQDGSSNPVYQVTTAGEYWVEVIDEFGCFAYDTMEVQFFTEQISLGNDTVMCEGDSVLITPGNGFVQYQWQDGSTGPEFLVKSPGEYWVEVLTDLDCTGKDTIRVSTLSEAIDLGTDVTICSGDSVYLSPGTGFTGYLWQDGSVSQGIIAKDSGTYWVEVTASGGCKATDTIEIALNSSPEVDLGQDTIIEIGETLELDAGPGLVYYFWQDGSSGRYFEVKQQGTYWVTVRNENCEASDTIYVIVDDCVASLTIPNCFTPNGDGFNDRFNVVSNNLNHFELMIFNRWGQLIFETEDVNEGWDGKVNGALSAVGTYFYLVKYSTVCSSGVDKSGNKAGSVTLLE